MEAATGQPMYFQVVRPGGGDAGGDARQLLSMQAFQLQDGASFEALASSSTSGGREDDKLRQRIMRLCMISVPVLVVHAVVNSFMNLAMFEDILRIEHEVHDVRVPSFFLMAVGRLQGLVFVLALTLVVQACGYCGAKHSRPCPLASFACCSCFHCCAGTVWLCVMGVFLLIMQVGGPQLESALVRCDPYQCMPRGNLTESMFVVDCLAAGVWDQRYVRRFGPEPRYPGDCPKDVLDCDSRADGEESAAREYPEGGERREAHEERAEGGERREAHEEREQGPVPSTAAGRRRQRRDDGRRRTVAAAVVPGSPPGSPAKEAKPPPMPTDVLGSCKADQTKVMTLHFSAVALPELMPQVLIWLYVKVALLLPVVLIGCLGFCWGMAMYDRSGHSRPAGLPPQHQIILQPVLGSLVTAGQPRDATMVQPLMRSPLSEAPL